MFIVAETDELPSEGAIGAIDAGVAMTKRRPFFGPNIDLDSAFKSAGTMCGAAFIDGTEEGAAIKSVATTRKRKQDDGYSTADKTPAMKPSDMPVVKPKDYDEFLQSYLNAHPLRWLPEAMYSFGSIDACHLQ